MTYIVFGGTLNLALSTYLYRRKPYCYSSVSSRILLSVLHCYMCFVRISRSSKLFCFSHRVINFESQGTERLGERGS